MRTALAWLRREVSVFTFIAGFAAFTMIAFQRSMLAYAWPNLPLGTLQVAAGGLDKVTRLVKVMSLVNSTPEFTEQISELYDRTFREAIHPRW